MTPTPASPSPSPENGLSVVLAGGGTAGHISPMIAIADALREEAPGVDITMVGTPSGMETRLVPAAGYELMTIDRVPMPRRPGADLLKLPGRFARAVRQAEDILKQTQADVVVVIVPVTEETVGLVDAAFLAAIAGEVPR